jgi:transcriptional repressor NrdR
MLKCPFCGEPESSVVDSRDASDGVRRRRECQSCHGRYTTYERLQRPALYVVKKDKRREEFSRDKLLTGLQKACEKRPLARIAIEELADEIEAKLHLPGRPEVTVAAVGDLVMEGLKRLDHVAYIRFASVYRDFKDIDEFREEIETLVSQPTLLPDNELAALTTGKRTPPAGGKRRQGY